MGSMVVLSSPPLPPAPELPPVWILSWGPAQQFQTLGASGIPRKDKDQANLESLQKHPYAHKTHPTGKSTRTFKGNVEETRLEPELELWEMSPPQHMEGREHLLSIKSPKTYFLFHIHGESSLSISIRDFLEARPKYGTDGSSYTTNISQEADPSQQGGTGSRRLTCKK